MTPAQQDYEFWICMAIMVEAAETMPDWTESSKCLGLCFVIERALNHSIIEGKQWHRLDKQIRLIKPRNRNRYYWPMGAWRPRVRAMKKLAKLALEG